MPGVKGTWLDKNHEVFLAFIGEKCFDLCNHCHCHWGYALISQADLWSENWITEHTKPKTLIWLLNTRYALMLVCPWHIFDWPNFSFQMYISTWRFGAAATNSWWTIFWRSGWRAMSAIWDANTTNENRGSNFKCSLVLILTKFCRVLLVVSVPPVPEGDC